VFVPLEADIYQKKVRNLMDAFQSQRSKRWFEEALFSRSCDCAEWNVTLPQVTRKLFTATSWCSDVHANRRDR